MFFRNALRSAAFSSGSDLLQNGCLAIVLGISEAASSQEPMRRPLPVASASPPTICSAPSTRTSVAVSVGMKLET